MPLLPPPNVQEAIKRHLPYIGLTSYIALDWAAVIILYALSKYVDSFSPHAQEISFYLNDPSLQHAHIPNSLQRVPDKLLYALTYWMPLGILTVVSAARYSLLEVHISILSFLSGYMVTWLSTDFVKQLVGRLRPDFWDRCQYDRILKVCTGDTWTVEEGRRSFPSGHSSSSFYACLFLMLFLAGKSGALTLSTTDSDNNQNTSQSEARGLQTSKLFRFMIALAPLFLSTYIALSRWQDHVHHPTDILAGSFLGSIISLMAYHMYFPSPFVASNLETMAAPRLAQSLAEEGNIRLPETSRDLE